MKNIIQITKQNKVYTAYTANMANNIALEQSVFNKTHVQIPVLGDEC